MSNAYAEDKYPYKDIYIYIPNPVAGDVYTISFDAWGSTTKKNISTFCMSIADKDIIAYSTGGKILGYNGRVEWNNLSEKSKRYFTTYKLSEGTEGTILIRCLPGTTYVRNIKLEKSPYPTDYEE